MDDAPLPLAQVAHAMPGRARLRVADRRGDAAYFASVSKGLAGIAGVRAVEVAPLTGSVLIQHSGPLARIGVAAQDARLFVVGEAPQGAARAAPADAIDPKAVAALALFAAALWQMSKQSVLPPAITLLWYASRLGGVWPPDGDGGNGE
jgi:hypothetical protein